ncbi:hypothetical protein BH23BAC2_BH23BAC2_24840 [soil metagenome]
MDFSKGSPPPDIPINTNWDPGIVAGIVVIVPLTKSIFFQPEYLLMQAGGNLDWMSTTYRFNYLSLPVLLRWEYEKFHLVGGPLFALLIDAEKEIEGKVSSATKEVEERNIGLSGGVGLKIYKSLELEGRYIVGYNHVGLDMTQGFQEFKFQTFQFSLSYYF